MKDNGKTNDNAEQELEKVINDTYHIVAECLETLNAKAASLIEDIKSGRLTKAEAEARQAEINGLASRAEHVKNMALNAEKKLDDYRENNS